MSDENKVSLTKDEVASSCRSNFSTFCKLIQDDGWFDKIHDKLCNFIQFHLEESIKSGKTCKIMLIMPRGSLKSTIVTRNLSAWLATRDPATRILISTNTHPNARRKLTDIRGIFDSHPVYRTLYPELIPNKKCRWTDDAAEIPRSVVFPEATFEGVGLKTKVIGRHYNVIIEDDTTAPDTSDFSEEIIVPSTEEIALAVGWHKSSIALYIPKGFRASIVVTTRWGDEDLVDYLQKNEKYHVFDVPAETEDGKILFTEFYDRERLDEIKASVGPYIYSCLWMNKPIEASLRTFKSEWFKYVSSTEIPEERSYSWALDPAISDNKKACESAITEVTHASQGSRPIFYWTWVKHGRLNPYEQIAFTLDRIQEFPEHQRKCLFVESNAFQAAMKYFISDELVKRRMNLTVVPIHSKVSKNARIEGLAPYFASGRIKFLRGLDPVVESQLTQFPHGKLVDVIDSYAFHYKALGRLQPDAPAEEVKPEWDSWDLVLDDIEKRRKGGDYSMAIGQRSRFDVSLSTGLGKDRDRVLRNKRRLVCV